MSLYKIKFAPGINRDTTDYSNTGGWYDCDKVRFRNGLPEKIGGWQKFITQKLAGTPREITRWSSLNGTVYTGVGTSSKTYINGGSLGDLQDVTPIRRTTSLTNPFTTATSSKTVIVTDSAHGCAVGDYVTFSGATAVGGVVAADLNKEFQVISVLSPSQYTITVANNATSAATGGGTVGAVYQLSTGLDSLVLGSGWGAGPFGGAASPFSTTTLGANPIAVTTASNVSSPYLRTTITVTTPAAHGLVIGDTVYLTGATTTGGVDQKFLNRALDIVTVPTTTTFTAYVWTNATSIVSGGGSAVVMQAYQKATATGWGSAATGSTLTLQIRLWSLENYGEDLLLNPRDGGIYYWIENTPTVRAINISALPNASNCPVVASKVIVSEIGQHVLAFGADPYGSGAGSQDKMLIRWSSDQRPEYWNELDTAENAGSLRLSNGSFIMTAEQTRQEILVWTDAALYSLQYKGSPYIFTSSLISGGTDIIGPNSVATAVSTTFWMGSDNFYYYDGSVNRMPCTVREKVFPNLNYEQRYKVYACINAELNEVIWFYPSNTVVNGVINKENDSYVIYNYAEKCWYYGSMPRTAWVDRSFGGNPLATSPDGYIFYQEFGADDGSTNPSTPINAYIISSPLEIEQGDEFGFVSRIIPDISFRETPNQNPAGTVNFTLYPQNYPGGMAPYNSSGLPTQKYGTGDTNAVTYNYAVNTFTQQMFTRIRGRSVIIKVASDQLGVQWRMGTPRLEIRQDGKR